MKGMWMDYWDGIVQRIFYRIQFEPELSEELASRIAEALVLEPIEYLTAEMEYESLAGGLNDGKPLPTLVPMRQTEPQLRDFIGRVVAHLDSTRPWPTPAFTKLPAEYLAEFENSRPIARLALTVDEVSARLARRFSHDSDDGPFLLLKMRSGEVIGMFSPYWDDSTDVVVYSADSNRDATDILRELTDTGRLEPERIFVLTAESAQQSAGRYETTSIIPAFHGESEPGNTVWEGTHVDYLDDTARREFRLFGYDGLLHDSKGDLFDTSAAKTLWTPGGGRAIFVMDRNGALYSAPFHLLGRFHHSSFLAGAPVGGAGEIEAKAGVVRLISDHSTHYQPTRKYTRQVLDSLRRQGVDTTPIVIEHHSAE